MVKIIHRFCNVKPKRLKTLWLGFEMQQIQFKNIPFAKWLRKCMRDVGRQIKCVDGSWDLQAVIGTLNLRYNLPSFLFKGDEREGVLRRVLHRHSWRNLQTSKLNL